MSLPPELIIDDDVGLSSCLEHIARVLAIGFDTEFVGEETFHPELCVVQVATPYRLFLIDAMKLRNLQGFWELLAEPSRTVIAHASRAEIRICQQASGKPPGTLVDVQLAAGLLGYGYPLGYGPLLQQVLGVSLTKGATLTDWRRRPLSASQIRYAFDDVRHLLPLWERMSNQLRERRRLSWADEEFETLKRRSLQEATEAERWRKLRGVGALDRRRLALVAEVYAWRAQRAEEVNRPARTVLRDDLVVEVAKRDPASKEELSLVRGLARGELNGVWEALERGRAVRAEDRPTSAERENDSPQITLMTNLLTAVLADWGTRHAVTPSLIATMPELRALVRTAAGRGSDAESSLTQGWRAVAVLPDLQAVLDGRRLIRIADPRSATPLRVVDA